MRRSLIVSAMAVMATSTVLTGCSDNSQAYCDSVRTAGKDKAFTAKNFGDAKVVDRAVAKTAELAGVAPDDIKPAWVALGDGIRANSDAMAAAGGNDPRKVDVAKIQAAVKKMQAMQRAADAIRKDTKDRCKYDISMS